MQFAEDHSDRQATDAVRARIEWKYAMGLDDPGFDFSVLCKFRARLAANDARGLSDGYEYLVSCENLQAPFHTTKLGQPASDTGANSVVLVEQFTLDEDPAGRAASRKIHEEPGVGINLHRIVTDGGHPGPDDPGNQFIY